MTPPPAERLISVVIPVRNGAATIERCLGAALASSHRRFEVVVVDDASEDGTPALVARYPCRLIRLPRRGGVSRARNAGARASLGELLLFVDADCLLGREALGTADAAYGARRDLVLGGTYTPRPHDRDFFSAFQSAFIHHFETKRPEPDYVAAHAMVIRADLFRASGGFIEDAFIGVAASVEDVEFSHRLRRAGCALLMEPTLQVEHVFGFSLRRSLANAVKKARLWTTYSLANRDLLADSGTASLELKTNVILSLAAALLLGRAAASGSGWPLLATLPVMGLDLFMNRGLVSAWARWQGPRFAALATLYYATLYAAAVGVGAAAGAAQYLWDIRKLRRFRSCTVRSGT
jgi:GT2 family glycosyltransferase